MSVLGRNVRKKISRNFNVYELVPPNVYVELGKNEFISFEISERASDGILFVTENFVDKRLVSVYKDILFDAEWVRKVCRSPVIINNWHLSQKILRKIANCEKLTEEDMNDALTYSGFREFSCKVGAPTSMHKLIGKALDLKISSYEKMTMLNQVRHYWILQSRMIREKDEKNLNFTRTEAISSKCTWLHIDMMETEFNKAIIVR